MPAPGWTSLAEILGKARRTWARGDVLRAAVDPRAEVTLRFALRAPTARELADHFGEAQDWAVRWRSVHGVELEERVVGGRLVGANRLPSAVVFPDLAALVTALGVERDVRRYRDLRASVPGGWTGVAGFVHDHPLTVLEHADRFTDLLAVVAWIEEHGGPGVLLRHVDVAGVDSKFVEQRAGVLAALLEAHLPAARVDPAARRGDLAARFGLRSRPVRLRVRSAHPGDGPWTDVSVPVDDLVTRPLAAPRLLVVENEATFEALEPPPGGALVWGEGYRAAVLGRLDWLSGRDVVYWGDLDTHGFAILDRLRAHHPRVRSVLMDEETLLRHRAHWGAEPRPYRGELVHLTAGERAVLDGLVSGRWQEAGAGAVRLEQERIRFGWARSALTRTW